MITDKIYNELSDEVYNLDPIKNPDLNKQLKKDDTINIGNDKFLVLSAEGNSATPTDSGMQAMAVAPIIDGQPDYNSIAVVAVATAKNHLLVSVLVQMLVITQSPLWNISKGGFV